MPNVLIVPVSGIVSFDRNVAGGSTLADLTSSVRLSYDQGGGVNITSYTTATTALNRFTIDGNQGRLFTVDDSLSGSLFSVNDISGLPILEVLDTDTVVAGKFGTNTLVVSGTRVGIGQAVTRTDKLAVSGNITVTGNISSNATVFTSVLSADVIGLRNAARITTGTGLNPSISMGDNSTGIPAGCGNFAVGRYAGAALTTGTDNVFIGNRAGRFTTTTGNNSFVGYRSGFNNTGSNNIGVGACAGSFNSIGNNNTFIGANANTINAATSAVGGVLVLGAGAVATQTNQMVLSTANISIRSLSGVSAGPNLMIGDNTTGNNVLSGNHNLLFGRCAGAVLLDGSHNTFIGQYAGRSNTTGSCNVFIGQSTGVLNSTGGFNILIGPTGGGLRTGNCNIMIGRANGLDYGVGTGSGNIFMGNSSGRTNTTGNNNTFIGQTTGRYNSTGCNSNFLGIQAGFNNTTGCFNNFFGGGAGRSNTTGNNNNFFGDNAGFNITGNNNVSFGNCAGLFVCVGNNNTFIGANANTINAATSAVGGVLVLGAGAVATQTNQMVLSTANISIRSLSGTQAGIIPGSPNLFIGPENTATGAGNNTATGTHNFVFGSCAANSLTTGCNNNVFGHRAGFCITTGNNNNFLGNAAGRCVQGGGENNFFGSYSGACGTGINGSNMMGRRAGQYATGSFNNFFGCQAGNRIGGSHNNFIGYRAGNGPTTGQATANTANNNNFFGNRSGYRITTGSCNTFIGRYAGCINTTGGNNTFIGRYAGCSNITGNNNIIIGDVANVTTDVVNGLSGWSNTVVIGNSATATANNQLVIGSVNSTLNGILFGSLGLTSLTNALSTIGGTSDNWNSAYTTLCAISSFYISNTITPATFPNGYTFSDADNTKTFHVDTTTASVSVLLPSNLSNGFSVTLISLGTNALQVSSTQTPMLCANGTRIFIPYSSTLLYKFNNLVWGLGSFT